MFSDRKLSVVDHIRKTPFARNHINVPAAKDKSMYVHKHPDTAMVHGLQ